MAFLLAARKESHAAPSRRPPCRPPCGGIV